MLTNDTPITTPEHDHFGIDPFAQALARAISKMHAPEGVVIGVNGPWGSGKSSALNLILYHLEPSIKEKKLKVVRFSPWWLSSTAAITAAFLGDLENAIGQSAGEAALKAFQNVARRVLRFGKVAEVAADIGLPGAGKAVEGVTQALDALLPNEDDIEAQQRKVSELLTKADCRFLVIMGSPDDLSKTAR